MASSRLSVARDPALALIVRIFVGSVMERWGVAEPARGDLRLAASELFSGVVEAGCKSIVGQRLKLSGMRWNLPGATGILTLRCHQASDRFDHIWTQPHNQIAAYPTA